MISLDSLPFGPRLANALVSYATYIGKMFWPTGLAVFYPYPWVRSSGQLFSPASASQRLRR